MQNFEETACHPVHTKNGPFVNSPISKIVDQRIDTPPKLPAAPHPSPINMDPDYLNSKSKEMFRTELLKACLLKIPEAVVNESVFHDYLTTRPSSSCEDLVSEDDSVGQCHPRLHKKSKLESECVAEDETPTDHDVVSYVNDSTIDLNPKQYSKLSANANEFDGKSECSKMVNSFHFGNNGKVGLPYINVSIADSINKKDGAEQFHDPTINRMVFYDHTTDHQEISRLLNVNSEWKEQSDSMFGGRSPCSDNMSTIAICASDASDISDEDLSTDLSTRSVDLRDMERSTDRPSNPNKKKSSSAVRRFLNWRRSLKFRKRAASLDESRFPFLANRFDSYKTEFELSV